MRRKQSRLSQELKPGCAAYFVLAEGRLTGINSDCPAAVARIERKRNAGEAVPAFARAQAGLRSFEMKRFAMWVAFALVTGMGFQRRPRSAFPWFESYQAASASL